MAALTGARISELCGLTWADIRIDDPEDAEIEFGSQSFVFSTGTGHPVQQRNVSRALREAQRRATESDGAPTFPILQRLDERGEPVAVPRGTLPSMHSFRHTVASRDLLAGDSVDEIAFLLGHRDANVTRAVYVREVADGRRRSLRRSRMVAEFGGALRVALSPGDEAY